MHILIATPNVFVGDGQSRVNYELASHLASNGHQVTLLADQVDTELSERKGIEWARLPAHSRLPALPRHLLWSRRATAWLSRNGRRYDILHLNGASAFVPHHVNTCHMVHSSFRHYLEGEPSYGPRRYYHRLYADFNSRAERRAYCLARIVVAVSARTARELTGSAELQNEKVRIVHNGVDVGVFRPDVAARKRTRHELSMDPSFFGVLFAGNFVSGHKGLGTLFKAFLDLPETVHLYIVGQGRMPNPELDANREFNRRVHYLGLRRDMPEIYAAMDCLAYPTRYDSFGLVILEALATGLPVITTRNSGAAELLRSGYDGVLLDSPFDVVGLRDWIVRLSGDPRLAAMMGTRGRLVAERNTWRRMAGLYASVYDEARTTS